MTPLERARSRLESWVKGDKPKIESPKDQSGEDQDIVAYVRGKLEDVRMASPRVANEGIWLTNIAYLCGFDSIYFDGVSRQFKPIHYPGQFMRRNRIHVNRILPTIQNRLARLIKNPPRYDVRPKSGDEDDKDSARLGKYVLEQFWDTLKINQKRINLMMWVQQCGHAYLKVCWDTSLGDRKVMPKDGGGYDVISNGDVRLEICSPFEIFPDPLAKTWDEAKWVIQAKVRDLNYFREHYPENGYSVKEEDCWLSSIQYEMRINAFNNQSGVSGSTTLMMKHSAIEISYYEKASVKHPYGRHIITANGIKLKDGILPIDELPFIKFDDVVIGGKFAPESIITHLRPLQDQLNRTKTMRAAWTNRLLAGKYISARGHGIAAEAFNDQSGEVVEYNVVPNAPEPKALQVPTIPQYAYSEDEFIEKDMNDTSGINEVARGQLPSASIPALGMQMLVEADDTRIGVMVESHEFSYADLGRILLKFVAEYYKEPRVLKIAGKNMEYTVKKFIGEDLKDNFDVHVIRGSTLPGSKVLKRQEIINLHQQGYFGNPQDPKVLENVLGMLEFGDVQEAWKRHALVMAQIQRGLNMVEKEGKKPPISEFDMHDLWIQEFDNYRLSEKFNEMDEDKKQLILETMNEHADFLQSMLQPSMSEDVDENPELKPTTAAQETEAEMESQLPQDFNAGDALFNPNIET